VVDEKLLAKTGCPSGGQKVARRLLLAKSFAYSQSGVCVSGSDSDAHLRPTAAPKSGPINTIAEFGLGQLATLCTHANNTEQRLQPQFPANSKIDLYLNQMNELRPI
jgi:hypothetical protein